MIDEIFKVLGVKSLNFISSNVVVIYFVIKSLFIFLFMLM